MDQRFSPHRICESDCEILCNRFDIQQERRYMALLPNAGGRRLSVPLTKGTKAIRPNSATQRECPSVRRSLLMRKGDNLHRPTGSNRTRQRLPAGLEANRQVRWWRRYLRRDFEPRKDRSLRGRWLTRHPVPEKSVRPNTKSACRDRAPWDASRRLDSIRRRERERLSLSPAPGLGKLPNSKKRTRRRK